MIRLFFFVSLALLIAKTAVAQPNGTQYENFKKTVTDKGWIINYENKLYLNQGESDDVIFELKAYRQYKIFFMSDDPEVDDADAWVYDAANNTLLGKDIETTRMAVVNIDNGDNRKVKVLGKNIKSTTPGKRSGFYILVVYKPMEKTATSSYDFSTAQSRADFFNDKMVSAKINSSNPTLDFNAFGKTDFDRRSIEFIAKNGLVYLKLHLPRNGSCDYGLKEILAEKNGQSGTVQFSNDTRGYYIAFKYSYTCNNLGYKDLYVTISGIQEADYETLKRNLN